MLRHSPETSQKWDAESFGCSPKAALCPFTRDFTLQGLLLPDASPLTVLDLIKTNKNIEALGHHLKNIVSELETTESYNVLEDYTTATEQTQKDTKKMKHILDLWLMLW